MLAGVPNYYKARSISVSPVFRLISSPFRYWNRQCPLSVRQNLALPRPSSRYTRLSDTDNQLNALQGRSCRANASFHVTLRSKNARCEIVSGEKRRRERGRESTDLYECHGCSLAESDSSHVARQLLNKNSISMEMRYPAGCSYIDCWFYKRRGMLVAPLSRSLFA